MKNHEIDYKIHGVEMQCVQIVLDPEEAVISEPGRLMFMQDGIKLSTIAGDGSLEEGTGFMGKLKNVGKKILAGEGIFSTHFKNVSNVRKSIFLSSNIPGSIIPIDLRKYNEEIIVQRDSFLACAKGVSIDIDTTQQPNKLRSGKFRHSYAGLYLQSLKGDGMVFLKTGGFVLEHNLAAGEKLISNKENIVAMTNTVISEAIFASEGYVVDEDVIMHELQGPGTVWIQSLPYEDLKKEMGNSSNNNSYNDSSNNTSNSAIESGISAGLRGVFGVVENQINKKK